MIAAAGTRPRPLRGVPDRKEPALVATPKTVLAGTAAALMCAAPLAAPAQAAPTTPVDGVYTAANRNYAVAAGRELLRGADTTRAARAHLRAEIHDLPADQRPFFAVGPLRGRSFTVRVVADYACLNATPGVRTVRAGACSPGDAPTALSPLRTAALSVDVLRVGTLDTSFPSTYWHGLDPRRLATFAGSAAPSGGRAAGITDRDEDGLDDDGRVTFRKDGSAVCLVLPLDDESSTRVVNTACGDLPARSTHDLSRAGQRAQLIDATTQVAEQIQQLSSARNVPVNELTDADLTDIEAGVDDRYSMLWFPRTDGETRPTQVVLVLEDRAGVAEFTTDTVGAEYVVDLGSV